MSIELLRIEDYEKCNHIWDMKKNAKLAERFFEEMKSGNRMIWVYEQNGVFLGEIALVKEENDPDYTIPNRRVYVSRLIVKREYRRQGIGRALVDFAVEKAREFGYNELSIGVNLDNFAALKLYIDSGFDKVLFIGEDELGKYVKLLKTI